MLHIEQIKNLSKYDVTHVTEESLAYFIDLTRRIIKLQCNCIGKENKAEFF